MQLTSTSEQRAFSLVELLVVIVVAGVLIALVLSGLRSAKLSAKRSSVLSEIRQHAIVFSQYSSDFQDLAPNFTQPTGITRIECCGWVVQYLKYFEAHYSWNIALANRYPSNSFQDDIFFATDGQMREKRLWTDYWYSSSFLTSPAFWRETTREGASQFKAQRLSDTSYPSLKGLLVGYDGLYQRAAPSAAFVGFVDTSAQRIYLRNMTPPYTRGAGAFWNSHALQSGWPVMHTVDGIRGVDVKGR